MGTLTPKEIRLIKVFLSEYKSMIEEVGVPFNPRSLTIVSQPHLDDENKFDFITYNKWFEEMELQTQIGRSRNIIETFIDIPINILISAEEAGRPMISDKDKKKLTKALRLLSEIRLGRQK